MSDQPPPDRASSDPSEQTAWDTVSETELDAALSHAASLAAQLSRQVQSADDTGSYSTPVSGDNPLDNPSTGLDAELEQLEELVGTAAAQIQSAEDAATVSQPTPPDSVPDFMSEFTTPAEPSIPAAPRPRSSDHRSTAVGQDPQASVEEAARWKPGIVGSGMMGVVGGPVKIPSLDVPRPAEPAPQAEAKREETSSFGRSLGTSLAAPLLIVLNGLVAVLELVDRPLAHIGGGVRRIIGWIAIAIIAASIVVFVRSVG
jgi:hypothetical protein